MRDDSITREASDLRSAPPPPGSMWELDLRSTAPAPAGADNRTFGRAARRAGVRWTFGPSRGPPHAGEGFGPSADRAGLPPRDFTDLT